MLIIECVVRELDIVQSNFIMLMILKSKYPGSDTAIIAIFLSDTCYLIIEY